MSEFRVGSALQGGDYRPPPRRTFTYVLVAVLVTSVLAVAIVLAYMAGKSGSSPTAAESSATAPVASVQQYASALAPTFKSLRDAWTDFEAKMCHVGASSLGCSLAPLSLSAITETLVLKIDGAAKPGVPAYIGAPPTEIAKLVAETRATAQRAHDAIPEDAASLSKEQLAAVWFEMNKLMDVVEKWDPYM